MSRVISRSYLLSSIIILLGLGCIIGLVYYAYRSKSKEEEEALNKYVKKIGALLTILMYLRLIKFLDSIPDLTPMVMILGDVINANGLDWVLKSCFII